MYAGHETKKAFRRFAAPFIRDAPRYAALHPVAAWNNAPVHLPNENTDVDVDVDGNTRRLATSNEQRATSNRAPIANCYRPCNTPPCEVSNWMKSGERCVYAYVSLRVQLIPIRLLYNAIITGGMAGTSLDTILPRVTSPARSIDFTKIRKYCTLSLFASPLYVIINI